MSALAALPVIGTCKYQTVCLPFPTLCLLFLQYAYRFFQQYAYCLYDMPNVSTICLTSLRYVYRAIMRDAMRDAKHYA